MNNNIEAGLLREANQVLLERNRRLVEALGDRWLLAKPVQRRPQ